MSAMGRIRQQRGEALEEGLPRRCMTAPSPCCKICASQRTSAVTKRPKTFNNLAGFERGLWQSRLRRGGYIPKLSVLEMHLRHSGL